MDAYEETGSYVFSGYAHTGAVLDRFSYTGPFSAGLELAQQRGQLYGVTEIDYVKWDPASVYP